MTTRGIRRLAFVAAFIPQLALAGTSVRNGGDLVSRELETTRLFLRKAAYLLRQEIAAKGQLPASVCAAAEPGDVDRSRICRAFLTSAIGQLIAMNEGPQLVPLVVTDRIWVALPSGEQREVDARTELGSGGSIEFSFPLVRLLTPTQLFQIEAHEFGHKVTFEGRSVTDDEKIAPFDSGRDLLDAAAAALVAYATQQHLIADSLVLEDRFACSVSLLGKKPVLTTEMPSRRYYADPKNFDRYTTGLGNHPWEPSITFPVPDEDAVLSLKLQILEPGACISPDGHGTTTLTLEKIQQKTGQISSVVSKDYPINPICLPHPEDYIMAVTTGDLTIDCSYVGSAAVGTSFRTPAP